MCDICCGVYDWELCCQNYQKQNRYLEKLIFYLFFNTDTVFAVFVIQQSSYCHSHWGEKEMEILGIFGHYWFSYTRQSCFSSYCSISKSNNLSGRLQWSHPFFIEGSRSVPPDDPREWRTLTSPAYSPYSFFRWRKAYSFAAILSQALKQASQKYYDRIRAEH